MATATRRKFLCHTLLTLTILSFTFLDAVKCNSSQPEKNDVKQSELKLHYAVSSEDTMILKCELIYHEYLTAVQNFTYCEIHHVRPFRLCLMCREQFQVAEELYSELNSNPDHHQCKIKYMMSDSIQIIPTVQTNMAKMWRASHCPRCYTQNDTLRARVAKFITLYNNLNACISAAMEEDTANLWTYGNSSRNTSDICILCKSQYTLLNSHFSVLYDADKGDVCMDIMDMMNYTRINWSYHFNCTSGSYDSTPVVVISCIVACTPILFYVYLRKTGKVRMAELFKPKRFISSTNTSSGSHSVAGSSVSTG